MMEVLTKRIIQFFKYYTCLLLYIQIDFLIEAKLHVTSYTKSERTFREREKY